MSGLTLGLMSMSLVDLEVLAKSGTPSDRKHATQIIPQAVCSRYGLAIGAAVAPIVQVLVWICFPLAYPISKLLDYLLGEGHDALFRRAELKTLVDFHGNEAGKGGELTRDETTIIAGALELTEKTAKDAMTPISETFSVDMNAKLDSALMKLILEEGHSRVPVYHEHPKNIIGLILVKNLLTIHPEDEIPVKNVTIRKIPRVSERMPLYEILNEFQKGHSHMAVVIKKHNDKEQSTGDSIFNGRDVKVDIDGQQKKSLKSNNRSFKKLKSETNIQRVNSSKNKKWANGVHSEVLHIDEVPLPRFTEEGEAIGIITLEDVIEELLQEEIFDETDYRDGHQ
ncbi:hypothetical protein JCGZ_12580 [Jatropha curcas]|uniref:CNNM transmembrane domain-containing protein n=1 Tax=Jatropha curcas TaxID=180498 RepID=A0A067KJX0_JATCU|nr:hypothetical protein JCGZ_12580 [Jatropha curcas]